MIYQKDIRPEDYNTKAFERLRNDPLKNHLFIKKVFLGKTIEGAIKGNHKYFHGKPYILSYADKYTDPYNPISLSDMFTEDIRLGCNTYGHVSPMEYFKDHTVIGKNKQELSDERTKMYNEFPYECTVFRPGILKHLIDFLFQGKKDISVLDPCMGWGDRLIACLASKKVSEYYGTDPNDKLLPRYKNIVEEFNINKLIDINTIPFEELEIKKSFDLVFTSPPYYDVETYSSDNTQSIVKFASEKEWFEGFLVSLLEKPKVNKGGYIALYVSQHRRHSYITWLIDRKYKGLTYEGVIATSGEGMPKPIFIWKKN
jgi:tRNA1(Val) A37 N6-methylase TrmN6